MNIVSTAVLLTLIGYLIRTKENPTLLAKATRELNKRERAEKVCRQYGGPPGYPNSWYLIRK